MVPRARMVHTKVWCSDQFLSLKPVERLLYIGLITLGDDHGRLRGDGRYLKHQLFPVDRIGSKKVEIMRNAIHRAGLIDVYSVQNGIYIQHPNWKKYQTLRADRAKESEYPAPPSDTRQPNDGQVTAEDKRTEDKKGEAKPIEETDHIESMPLHRKQMLDGKKAALIEGVGWPKNESNDTVSPLPTNGETLESARSQHRSSTTK